MGSTALQRAFAQDAGRLLADGVLYPAVDFQGLAYLAATALGRQTSVPLNYAEGHNALGFKMITERGGGPVPGHHQMLPHTSQMRHAIAEQVSRFNPERLVLASEVFANFGAISEEHIDEIAKIAGPDAEVIAVLRRPDEYIVSWHLQRLRFGHRIRPISEEIRHYSGTIHLDYRRMIEPWLGHFKRVTLVPYAEVKSVGGLPTWFGGRIGVKLAETRQNVGLHRGLAEIARRAVLELDDPVMFDWLHSVKIDLPPSEEVELLGLEARRNIRRQFEPVHDWLSTLAGRPEFFDDLDESVKRLAFNEADLRGQVVQSLLDEGSCPNPKWLEKQA